MERVFVNEVRFSSLSRKLLAEEFAGRQFGSELGPVYAGSFVLGETLGIRASSALGIRIRPGSTGGCHLRRDHFGLAEIAMTGACRLGSAEVDLNIHFLLSGKLAYTTGEISNHRWQVLFVSTI